MSPNEIMILDWSQSQVTGRDNKERDGKNQQRIVMVHKILM